MFVAGPGGLAFIDAGFDQVQRPDRHRTAVHPPQQAGPVENGQIPPHRLGGDVVGLRQIGNRGTPLGHHRRGDGLLAFLRVHGSPSVWG